MAHNGQNDKQQRGFQTSAQKAQEKIMKKFFAQKVTRRELADFEQAMRSAFGTILAVSNWIIDNAGLREKYEAAIAAEKAAQEASTGLTTVYAPANADAPDNAAVPVGADSISQEVSE